MRELAHLGGMRELALFAGAGGGILGGHLLGWRTVCAVEWADYPRKVLLARQRDGILPRFPIWDDVQTFDGSPWRGRVDVVSGGFPCQDISAAGKGAGIDGSRSGMWFHMARIVCEVRPRFVFVENSPMLTSRGLGRVLGDLAAMGYDAEWGVLGAVDAGAPHQRDRIWVVANATSKQHEGESPTQRGKACAELLPDDPSIGWGAWRAEFTDGCCQIPDSASKRWREARRVRSGEPKEWIAGGGKIIGPDWWAVEPRLGRVAHGVAHRVDRLRAIGNGQVPAVAAMAFRELAGRLMA
jgi:DNA (cytosine-5)-methyltransferase 1